MNAKWYLLVYSCGCDLLSKPLNLHQDWKFTLVPERRNKVMDKVTLSDTWQKYLIICSEGLWLVATDRVGRFCLHRLRTSFPQLWVTRYFFWWWLERPFFWAPQREDRKWNSEAEVADVRLTQTNGVLAQTLWQHSSPPTTSKCWSANNHGDGLTQGRRWTSNKHVKYALHLPTSAIARNRTRSNFLSETKKPVGRVSCYSLAVVHFLNACGYLYLISRVWSVKRDDSLTG